MKILIVTDKNLLCLAKGPGKGQPMKKKLLDNNSSTPNNIEGGGITTKLPNPTNNGQEKNLNLNLQEVVTDTLTSPKEEELEKTQ